MDFRKEEAKPRHSWGLDVGCSGFAASTSEEGLWERGRPGCARSSAPPGAPHGVALGLLPRQPLRNWLASPQSPHTDAVINDQGLDETGFLGVRLYVGLALSLAGVPVRLAQGRPEISVGAWGPCSSRRRRWCTPLERSVQAFQLTGSGSKHTTNRCYPPGSFPGLLRQPASGAWPGSGAQTLPLTPK